MTKVVTVPGETTTIVVAQPSAVRNVRTPDAKVVSTARERIHVVTVIGSATRVVIPEQRVVVVRVPSPVTVVRTGGLGGGGAPAFDDLDLATDTPTPDMLAAVYQAGAWKRATWAQLASWLGAIDTLPDGLVYIDDSPVVIDDSYMVIS